MEKCNWVFNSLSVDFLIGWVSSYGKVIFLKSVILKGHLYKSKSARFFFSMIPGVLWPCLCPEQELCLLEYYTLEHYNGISDWQIEERSNIEEPIVDKDSNRNILKGERN